VLDLSDDFCNELSYILDTNELGSLKASIEQSISDYIIGPAPKLNLICDIIESKMLENQDKYMFNILVIYSKKSPPKLEKGLTKIKQIKDENAGKEMVKKPPHLHAATNSTPKTKNYKELLKYFCWLVKAEELYNLSLSIYDLDMAIMIAEFTNMDPKEYLPYIESLKSISREIDFKTKICCDLKMFSKAIDELSRGDENDYKIAIELIVEKELFSHGIKTFKQNKDILDQLKHLLGIHLFKKKDYKQAAFYLFAFPDEEKKILESCKKIYDWQTGLQYLEFHKKEQKIIDQFLNEMVEIYKKMKAFDICAKIMKYLKRPLPDIFAYYIKVRDFKKAKSLILCNTLSADATTAVQSELKIATSIELNGLHSKIKNISYWLKRLEIVQEQKMVYKDNNFQPDMNDNMSVMSESSNRSVISDDSGVSSFSKITGMSLYFKSKNKKPKNLTSRKLKEGSLYEEEWLVESLNKEVATEEDSKRYFHLLTLLIKFDLLVEFEEIRNLLQK
jgi:elongator complex protein 1